MGRHWHVVNVRVDGLAPVLGTLLHDPRIRSAALVDVDSGMTLDACTSDQADPDLEVQGAGHAEVVRVALDVLGGPGEHRGRCELVVDDGVGRHHLMRVVPDGDTGLLVLSVVVAGPERFAARVRRRLRRVSVAALTAGPSTTRRPSALRRMLAAVSPPIASAPPAPSPPAASPWPAPPASSPARMPIVLLPAAPIRSWPALPEPPEPAARPSLFVPFAGAPSDPPGAPSDPPGAPGAPEDPVAGPVAEPALVPIADAVPLPRRRPAAALAMWPGPPPPAPAEPPPLPSALLSSAMLAGASVTAAEEPGIPRTTATGVALVPSRAPAPPSALPPGPRRDR